MSGNAYSLKHAYQKDSQRNKKTKKIKLRLKMLVGLQPIYLLQVVGMSSKSIATLCHFKKSNFSVTKTSRWKFLDLKPTHFAVRIVAPLGNNRSTAEELGERMLYIRNTSTQICRYIESYKPLFLFFFEIAETISVMLLICGFAVDFNFFTANPQMFAARNRFANPQTKTLSPQFAGLRTCRPVCGSAQHWKLELIIKTVQF